MWQRSKTHSAFQYFCVTRSGPLSVFTVSQLSLSLSSYYLFLLIFRTKADKIRDLEFRTVSTFSGACQVSPESSAVSVSVSPYSNSRLGDSMELCEEQEKKKKENYTWAYTFHLTPNTNHRCPDAHMQTDSQTYCRLFTFFFFATPTTTLHSAHSNSAHHPHTLFRLVHSFCLMVCILEVLIGCRISRQRWLAICIVFFPPLKSSYAEPLTSTDALYGH